MKKPLTTLLIIVEPLIILTVIYTFWFHSPPIRDAWIWILWLAVPIFALRIIVFERLWTNTPLTYLLFGFVLLTTLNFYLDPFARDDYLVLLSRPLLGIWIFLYMVDHAQTWGRLQALTIATVSMSLILAIVSLTTTSWQMDKSGELAFIINAIPRFEWHTVDWSFLPLWLQSRITLPPISEMGLAFNPNEVAGALAFVVPLMAGLAIGNPRNSEGQSVQQKVWVGIRIAAAITCVLSMLSLLLGQSRFAIGGVLGALILVVLLLLRDMRWKIVGLSIVSFIILLQAALLFNFFPFASENTAATGLSGRDQNTLSTRFEIWASAARMMVDYPLTGAGMSMFRTAVNEEAYQIEYYVRQHTVPPHAHNEWLQVGADLGIPGLLMFLAMQGVVLWMLWQGWKGKHPQGQIMAVAVFGGLLAHSVYGLGDAITFWDRFSFILWWLVGLAGAQYVLSQEHPDTVT